MLCEPAYQPGRLDPAAAATAPARPACWTNLGGVQPLEAALRAARRRARQARSVALGLACGMADMTRQTAALAGISERDAGVDAGLINASQQAGAALGLAMVATIADDGVAARLAAARADSILLRDARRGPTIVPPGAAPICSRCW